MLYNCICRCVHVDVIADESQQHNVHVQYMYSTCICTCVLVDVIADESQQHNVHVHVFVYVHVHVDVIADESQQHNVHVCNACVT